MIDYSDRPSKDEYNKELVYYCKKCLSLSILPLKDIMDYCDTCGSTEIGQTDIFTWENMYEKKYGIKFLNQK